MTRIRIAVLRYGCLCLLWLLLSHSAGAQQARGNFASLRLEQMAWTLMERYGVDCSRAALCAWGKDTLRVTEDALHRVDHIGLRLFAEETMAEMPSPVYRFVERYLLELCLEDETDDVVRRLKEDKVTLRFGEKRSKVRETRGEGRGTREEGQERRYGGEAAGREELKKLRERLQALPEAGGEGESSLVILTDNHYYTVSLYRHAALQLTMRFPIQYELLWGMNKKEVESTLYTDLLHFRMPQASEASPREEEGSADGLSPSDYEVEMLTATGDSCFVLTGEPYIIDAVNDNRHYRLLADGRYVPLCDVRRPEESVCNLFLFPQLLTEQGPVLDVTQRLYNRRKLSFDVSLARLLAYCREMGCRPYVGIEKLTEERVEGTVVLLNSSHGYCHQLFFSADRRVLTRPDKYRIEAELYAYVPTHNIGALFQEGK